MIRQRYKVHTIKLENIIQQPIDYQWLWETYVLLQSAEIWSCLGPWVESSNPQLGPVVKNNFYRIAQSIDRTQIQHYMIKKTNFAQQINHFLGCDGVLCFPTTPVLAPKLGTLGNDLQARISGTYYSRTLGMNAIAGLSKTPQISMPVATVNNIPIGLSILAGHGQDTLLTSITPLID